MISISPTEARRAEILPPRVFYERTKVANAPKRARREKTLSPALPLYGEGEPSGKSLALVTPLAIEGERGWG